MYVERTDNMNDLFPELLTLSDRELILRPLEIKDAEDLRRLTLQEEVYRFLPTFLFEKKYPDIGHVLDQIYKEGLNDSLILGVFRSDRFCGLAEIYGYASKIHKVSVGYRLLKEEWGKGIATRALKLMLNELTTKRGIEIITASTMLENIASACVLKKNGFTLVNHNVEEDWGYPEPTPTDKWIL